MYETEFVVEQAGCASCAERIRGALKAAGEVQAVDVDEAADAALVRIGSATPLAEDAVGRALQEASSGSGHVYRLRPGSWFARHT